MPEIGRIQSTNFQSLLTDLGITRNQIPFGLQSEVMPVVLVGGTVSFLAAPTPAYRVQDIFTAGLQVAPAAGSLLADTGPLPAGVYGVSFFFMANVPGDFELQWRNAANSANLWIQEMRNIVTEGQPWTRLDWRFDVENDNERFRLTNVAAGAALTRWQATILART